MSHRQQGEEPMHTDRYLQLAAIRNEDWVASSYGHN
jgi:hypothetical protein